MATPEELPMTAATKAAIDQFKKVREAQRLHLEALKELGLLFLDPDMDMASYILATSHIRKEYIRDRVGFYGD